MKLIPFFFLASLASAARLGSRKLAKDSPEPVAVDGEYIVLLKKGNMPEKVLTKKFLGPKAKIDAVYGGIDGALLKNVTKKDVARLTRHPLIEVVEANQIIGFGGGQPEVASGETFAVVDNQDLSPDDLYWGLDRVDQSVLPLDHLYRNDPLGGKNVDVYVLDSGIHVDHVEFAGRAVCGRSIPSYGGSCDPAGHGTHIAGIIGGQTLGVAKQVNLIGVQVLDADIFGTTGSILSGMNWILNHLRPDAAGHVINMSLGAPFVSKSIDKIVDDCVNAGIVVVTAAGNDGRDACGYSPARASGLTVGATKIDDHMTWWSNYGPCVDILAPSHRIYSSFIATLEDDGPDSTYAQLSGTSFGAPFVSGAAALYLAHHPGSSPEEVKQALVAQAARGVLKDVEPSTPNLLVQTVALAELPPPLSCALAKSSCELNGDCCSKKCNGKPSARTCK